MENGLTPLEPKPVSMNTCEKSRASRIAGRNQGLFCCTGKNEVEMEKTSKRTAQSFICKWKMKVPHCSVVQMLKTLNGCQSLISEVSEGETEKWMCISVVT